MKNKTIRPTFHDFLSGFFVFLLAMPLSLGIAKASNFPPLMGLLTAGIGGLVVSWFSGSRLSIKGPAAGLIVIVAGSVTELGKGDPVQGWILTSGVLFLSAVLQLGFGKMKLGRFIDFFPLPSIQGMLSAIGIIILSKQVHLILGNSPLDAEGNPLIEPIELLMAIPDSLNNINHISTIIGLIGMTIVLTWHRMPIAFLRKFPAPLVVLLMTIPLSMVLKLPKEQTIQFQQNFFDSIRFQLDFSGWENFGIFIKYILLFAIIGSLESLLTVRAVDIQTPKEPKSNPNKDLMSIGFGNILCSLFGGLPMISEVARSSANVSSGAKTQWSSFFHGFFILLFLVFSVHFSGFIPTAALSALLVAVGIRLINPKEFFKIFKLGKGQFWVFISTIIITLFTDLLIGISAGILVNIGFLYFNGTPFQRIFRPKLHWNGNVLMVNEAATFANWLGIQKEINTKKRSEHIVIDFSNCSIMDQTVQENVFHLGVEFSKSGGSLISR